MTKIKITTLESLLQIGKLTFTYTTVHGDVREAVGSNNPNEIPGGKPAGGINANGSLTYYDLDAAGWRTVHTGAEIEALLSTDNPNWQVPTKAQVKASYLHPYQQAINAANASATMSVATAATLIGINPLTPQELANLLETTVVKFKYVKKSDGSERVAYGTRDTSRLPASVSFATTKDVKGNVSYFDIEKQAIRTVSGASSIELIATFDVPLKK